MSNFHFTDPRTRKRRVLISLAILIIIFFLYDASIKASPIAGFITFVLIIIFVLLALKWKTKKPTLTDAGQEWATGRQLHEANHAPGSDGTAGVWIGDGFRRSKFFHSICIAGAGMGKAVCRLIQTGLLEPVGSYVFNDIKGELCYITARAQKMMGQTVYIFDPFDNQYDLGARHGIKSCGFNPLEFIKRNPEELRDNCDAIAYYLVPDNPNDREPFWRQRSRSLIRTILCHILTFRPKEEHNFYTLYKMLRVTGDEWLKLLIEMKKNTALDGLISVAAEEFIGMNELSPTFAGIRSNAQDATTLFESPQLRNFFQKDDFNPYDLTNGNCTVYLILPERFINTHYAFLRLIIGLCLKACNAKPTQNKVHFFLDELPLMKRLEDVQRAFSFGRGQNIHMHIFAQSIAGLKEIYGEDGVQSFIANSAVIQCFLGVRDMSTRETFSKLLGNVKRIKTQKTQSYTSGNNGGSSSTGFSEVENLEPLLSPEEIGTGSGIITIIDGLKTIFNHQPYFKNRFEGVSPKETWLTKEQRAEILAGRVPVDEYKEYFMQMADVPPLSRY